MSSISGQMQGLDIGIHAVAESNANNTVAILNMLGEQNASMKRCLEACTNVLAASSEETGTTVRYAEAIDAAQQLIGNIGNVDPSSKASVIDKMIARNNALQIGGNVSAEVALAVLNMPSRKVALLDSNDNAS